MGFEPTTFSLGSCHPRGVSGDKAKTYEEQPRGLAPPLRRDADADPGLAAVISAWPGLPEALRAGILATVKAAGQTPEGW